MHKAGFKPEEISSDAEGGLMDSSPAGEWMRSQGIAHRTKTPEDVNALGVLDRAMATVKKAISRHMIAGQQSSWLAQVPGVIDNYNKHIPQPSNLGATPEQFDNDERWIS